MRTLALVSLGALALMTPAATGAAVQTPSRPQAPAALMAPRVATADPVADPAATVVEGHARFTMLTPRLVRMEWSATDTSRSGRRSSSSTGASPSHTTPCAAPAAGLRFRPTTSRCATGAAAGASPRQPRGAAARGRARRRLAPGRVGQCQPQGHDAHAGRCQGSRPLGARPAVARGLDRAGRQPAPPVRPEPMALGHGAARGRAPGPLFLRLRPRLQGRRWPTTSAWPVACRCCRASCSAAGGRATGPTATRISTDLVRDFDRVRPAARRAGDRHGLAHAVRSSWENAPGPGGTGQGLDRLLLERGLFPDPERFLAGHAQGLRTPLNLHPARAFSHGRRLPARWRGAMGIDPATKRSVPFRPPNKPFARPISRQFITPLEQQGVDFWWLDWQQGDSDEWPGSTRLVAQPPALHATRQRGGSAPDASQSLGRARQPPLPDRLLRRHVLHLGRARFQPYFTATAANVGYGWWSHDIGGHLHGRAPNCTRAGCSSALQPDPAPALPRRIPMPSGASGHTPRSISG